MVYEIHLGDNQSLYGSIAAVQAVITDPPYGDEVHSQEKVGRNAQRQVDAVPVPFGALTREDRNALARYCEIKCRGWALVFCQTEQISDWRYSMEGRTLDAIRYYRPMLWIKPDARPNFRGNGPGIGHETIQAYWCGAEKQRWNGGGKVGVFHHVRDSSKDHKNSKHPTQKPVSLMKELVRYFTNPGDTVFDPFMGCGSTGVAALELGRNFIGIEKNPEYFEEAERRLKEASRPGLMIPADKNAPTLFGDSAFGSRGTRRRLEREAKEKGHAD